jgi:hypothetical protein
MPGYARHEGLVPLKEEARTVDARASSASGETMMVRETITTA